MDVKGNCLVANQRISDHFRGGHKLSCFMFIGTIIYTNNYILNYYNYAENWYMIARNKRLELLAEDSSSMSLYFQVLHSMLMQFTFVTVQFHPFLGLD